MRKCWGGWLVAGLLPGDLRLLDDCSAIDDRGLEIAEALLHERRYLDDLTRRPHPDMDRALQALAGVRRLTKRAA